MHRDYQGISARLSIILIDLRSDDNCSKDAIDVLSTNVRVIPTNTVLRCLEGVRKFFSRRNWTLGYTRNTISPRTRYHGDTMPMDTGAFVFEIVGDRYTNNVSPRYIEERARVLVIDKNSTLVEAIRSGKAP